MQPTGFDVATFLGKGTDDALIVRAEQHVGIVRAMARSYTRGQGFDKTSGEPAEDVAAVITTACARLVVNPAQWRGETVGPFARTASLFAGWTLAETLVLNRYRQRAA